MRADDCELMQPIGAGAEAKAHNEVRIGRAQEVVHSVSLGQIQGHSRFFEFCTDTYRPRLPRPPVRPSVRPGPSGSVRVRPGPSGPSGPSGSVRMG